MTVRRPAVAGAIVTCLVLLLVANRYGYHRDELYFLASGRHPSWGYPDQPPLVPLLARLLDHDSLVLLRAPSALAAGVVVLLAGSMAELLGAQRSGQWLAVGATALSGFVLAAGHLLSTVTPSLLGWTLVTWLVLRATRGGHPRMWLLVGVVGGLTFQANPLVGALLLALAVARPRDPWPWLAGGVALVFAAPYVLWQAGNGWPQLDIARHIADGGSTTSVSRPLFVAQLALQVGPWLLPVWLVGLRRLLRERELRFLGLTFLLLAALFLVLGGKPYYLGGLFPLLFAAGAQPLVDRLPQRAPTGLLALSTPVLLFALPVLPVSSADSLLAINPDAGNTIGWASFASQVQAHEPRLVITANYGEAGALERYTALPVYSGHNAYGLWAVPPDGEEVLLVGLDPDLCVVSELVGEIQLPVDNEENGVALRTCTPRAPWSELWPRLRRLG